MMTDMTFQGEVLPIRTLVERALTSTAYTPSAKIGVRHIAVESAVRCAELLAAGDTPEICWRFGILQTLDHYTSTLRRGGAELASGVFRADPAPTGSRKVDAAFGALADHLAQRDGWAAPSWVMDPIRRTARWYPDVPTIFREEARRDSPPAFRRRGIFITGRSLSRA